jgi:hypothetical protein
MSPKRIGRPTREAKPGERVTLGLRVTADMKNRIEEQATKNGRSLSQEAEMRLERSFDLETLLAHPVAMQAETLRQVLREFFLEGKIPRKGAIPIGKVAARVRKKKP